MSHETTDVICHTIYCLYILSWMQLYKIWCEFSVFKNISISFLNGHILHACTKDPKIGQSHYCIPINRAIPSWTWYLVLIIHVFLNYDTTLFIPTFSVITFSWCWRSYVSDLQLVIKVICTASLSLLNTMWFLHYFNTSHVKKIIFIERISIFHLCEQ